MDEDDIQVEKNQSGQTDTSTFTIIWAAMLATTFIYLGISFYMLNVAGWDAPMADKSGMILGIFAAVTLADIGAAIFLKKSMVDENTQLAMPLVVWALFEAIAVYGLIASFLTGVFTHGLPFYVVAAAALLMSGPDTFANLREGPKGE